MLRVRDDETAEEPEPCDEREAQHHLVPGRVRVRVRVVRRSTTHYYHSGAAAVRQRCGSSSAAVVRQRCGSGVAAVRQVCDSGMAAVRQAVDQSGAAAHRALASGARTHQAREFEASVVK